MSSDIGVGETNQRTFSAEVLSDEQTQILIASTASESKCLALGVLGVLQIAENQDVWGAFQDLNCFCESGSEVDFSQSYFTAIYKQQMKYGTVLRLDGDRFAQVPHRYYLSDAGRQLALPWAGHLLAWVEKYDVNLKDFWNEPRVTKPDETAGTLIDFALLAKIDQEPASRNELENMLDSNLDIGVNQSDLVSRWVKNFIRKDLVHTEDGLYFMGSDEREAIREFLIMLTKLTTLDPVFISEGYSKMEAILNKPESVMKLLANVSRRSTKKPDSRYDWANFAPQIIAAAKDSDGSIPMTSIKTLFPKLTDEELRRLRRKIRKGQIEGVAVLTSDEPGGRTHINNQTIVIKSVD